MYSMWCVICEDKCVAAVAALYNKSIKEFKSALGQPDLSYLQDRYNKKLWLIFGRYIQLTISLSFKHVALYQYKDITLNISLIITSSNWSITLSSE